MQSPIDAVFDGFGLDAFGEWHHGNLMDFWRWGFSDLADGEMKGSVAELLVKVLLRAEPESITPDEMLLLRMSRISAASPDLESDPGYQYDA